MSDQLFFGYGSLVNRDTHSYMQGRTARLSGWRRMWRHTAFNRTAFLTAVPAPGHMIEGLVAVVPSGNWDALDARETGYERVVSDAVEASGVLLPEVTVYSIPAGLHAAPPGLRPVLLSYLDVVVQGYRREFGPEGVSHFFETTDGWDAPILDDRCDPQYPRHQILTAEERDMVDGHLHARGANVVAA